MKILVINCGSSSLKYQLIDSQTEKVMAKGICDRIGINGSNIVYQPAGGDKETTEAPMPTHSQAIKLVLEALVNEKTGVIRSLDEVGAIGHRVVQGGDIFPKSVIVDDDVLEKIDALSDLAPLHNPAHVIGIKACMENMPGVPNVTVFDTSFHQTMPEEAYIYGIPYEYYEKYKIRRYGAHGTSHSYVSERAAEMAGVPYNQTKTIVCHLGNGASICAVENGKSVDTSMGLTPLEGLVMGTRCGDIDPTVMEYLAKKEGLSISEIMTIFNKKSGVLGITGFTSDFRDIEAAIEEGNPRAKLAMDVFAHRVVRYVGAFAAVMNGVDNIAFTAGLGENNADIRTRVCEHLGYLGVKIDEELNQKRGEDLIISTSDSKVKVMVIPTNEELAIARQTLALVQK